MNQNEESRKYEIHDEMKNQTNNPMNNIENTNGGSIDYKEQKNSNYEKGKEHRFDHEEQNLQRMRPEQKKKQQGNC